MKAGEFVINDTSETLKAKTTLLDCDITDLDLSSSGLLTDAVLRNCYFLGKGASLLGQDLPVDVMPGLPREYSELCIVE